MSVKLSDKTIDDTLRVEFELIRGGIKTITAFMSDTRALVNLFEALRIKHISEVPDLLQPDALLDPETLNAVMMNARTWIVLAVIGHCIIVDYLESSDEEVVTPDERDIS